MSRRLCVSFFILLACCGPAAANPIRDHFLLAKTGKKIHGQVLDYTRNHGSDKRIWSNALCEKRDLYVYLPPCYDPKKQYPLILWLHGVAQDELSFVRHVVAPLDEAINCGKLPPVIIACPDGSIRGRVCIAEVGSFFLDTKAGKFEQFVMEDVWNFLHERFPIRPEREAHVLAGVSMGGGAAFHHAFKYPDRVKVVVGVSPPLNTRWIDCRGRYQGNFDPDCWGWRTDYTRRWEVVARFNLIFTVRLGQIIKPLYDRFPNTADLVAMDNPIEMLEPYDVTPGKFSMFVAYGGKDEFNIDAQVESFLYMANQRKIPIEVVYRPDGRHNKETALSFVPAVTAWLSEQLAPYAPR